MNRCDAVSEKYNTYLLFTGKLYLF